MRACRSGRAGYGSKRRCPPNSRRLLSRRVRLPIDEPAWFDLAAVTRSAISTPRLHRLFKRLAKKDSSDEESLKPFNFLEACYIPPNERPETEQHIVLVVALQTRPQ
jgi:hypothetical protein